jgi:hypothetical protein
MSHLRAVKRKPRRGDGTVALAGFGVCLGLEVVAGAEAEDD